MTETEGVRVIKEGLVLFDGLAFIIEDRPTTADPARLDCGSTFDDGTGLSLDFFLNLATEAVGIAEAHLDLESAGRQEIAGVRFTSQGGGEDGLLRPEIALQVVDDARAGLSQQRGGVAQRISKERLALLQSQIRHKSSQGVPFRLGRLAHDGGACDQPQRIEGYLSSGCRWGR